MKVGDLAKLLDLTPRRVQQLAGDGVIPRPDEGEYDPPRCIVAYVKYLRRLAAGEGSLSLTDERTRLARLQADGKELELQRAREDLVELDWVVEAFGRVFERFRARALSLPAKAAARSFGAESIAEAKRGIEAEVHELLAELSYPDNKTLSTYARRVKGKKKAAGASRGNRGNGPAAGATDN